jgi:hypothetical protein
MGSLRDDDIRRNSECSGAASLTYDIPSRRTATARARDFKLSAHWKNQDGRFYETTQIQKDRTGKDMRDSLAFARSRIRPF